MIGPPSVVSSCPATASRLSRTTSASARREFARQYRRFSGSAVLLGPSVLRELSL